MLKVPDTAATSTPDAADAARTAVAVPSGIVIRQRTEPGAGHVVLRDAEPGIGDRRQHRVRIGPRESLGEDAEPHHTDPAASSSLTGRPSRDRLRDRDHRPDRGNAVIGGRAAHRPPVSTASAKPSTWRR